MSEQPQQPQSSNDQPQAAAPAEVSSCCNSSCGPRCCSRGRRGRKFIALFVIAAALFIGFMVTRAHAEEGPGFDSKLGAMHNLIVVIEDFARVSSNASTSGVAAVLAANDQFKNNEDAIAFYEKVLPQADDATVKRAIRIKLIELYKKSGDREKANANLEKLITGRN